MWSDLWRANGVWLLVAPVAAAAVVVFAVDAGRTPVRRAPWAGAGWGRVVLYPLLCLLWAGDALLGTGRSPGERIAKGLFVVAAVLSFAVRTLRWQRAGRPDAPTRTREPRPRRAAPRRSGTPPRP